MGVYLLIIAVVDSYYRGEYIIFDRSWRKSELCKFAGFISTFSSELSVFTLTVITLDRLICIIFPLKLKRLGIKQASIVMPCIWIVVILLSGIPLFGLDYFDNFYGRSGVCLAFHITPDKPKGWEYSVFVFLVLNFLSFLVIFISYLWMFLVAKQTTTAVRKSKAKSDNSMAKRMTLIVMSDFFCWVPIILLGFASLGGATVPPQVCIATDSSVTWLLNVRYVITDCSNHVCLLSLILCFVLGIRVGGSFCSASELRHEPSALHNIHSPLHEKY